MRFARASGKTCERKPTAKKASARIGKKREEREVGHRPGLLAALDVAVVLHACAPAWSTTGAAPAARSTRAIRRAFGEATGSGHGRRGPQREVACGLPAELVVVDVEVEVVTSNSHSKSASSSKARSSSASARWWAIVTCGWYGNVQVDVERSAAYGLGELLALGDALDQRHEHHRRDRAEGAGAAQVDGERARAGGDRREVRVDVVEVAVGELGRRQQRDVRRDRGGLVSPSEVR